MGICPSSPVCPLNNQCTFDSHGVSFALACGWNFSGAELKLAYAGSITECMVLCSITDQCTAVSFASEECYMKSNFSNGGMRNPYITSAYIYTNLTTPNATEPLFPTSSESCAIDASCPEDDINCSIRTNTPAQIPIVLPNVLFKNGAFEYGNLTSWTLALNGSAHPDNNYPSTRSPRSGHWVYEGKGLTNRSAWGVTLSQQVTVTPRRSYSIVLWSKQSKKENCVCSVSWRADTLRMFTPGLEYERTSVMFPVWDVTDGDVAIGFECARGGQGVNFHLDDVDMKLVWAG